MTNESQARDRRTTVDEIFDDLYDEIATMRLRPGDRISELEVAEKFGVSRQPVRDAFSRLANLDLLLIRPQRATEVKRFSTKEIEKSRFVRWAVEAEILRRAAEKCDEAGAVRLDECLAQQREAIERRDYDLFGRLDYEFHRTLCQIAGAEFAFDVIAAEKAKVDRLCILGLSKEDRMPQLLEDHGTIANMVKSNNQDGAAIAGKLHLSRLDSTIEHISKSNSGYFDSEST